MQLNDGLANSSVYEEFGAGGECMRGRIEPCATVAATTLSTAFIGPVYNTSPSSSSRGINLAKLRLRKSIWGTRNISVGTGFRGAIATVKAAGVTIDGIGINLNNISQ